MRAPRRPRFTATSLVLLLGAAILPACRKADAVAGQPAAASSAVSAEAAASARTPAMSARALGLSKNTGTTPVDVQLEAAQQMLRRFPDLRDSWIALGRLWVRKAREAGDPGFYLYAKACADVSLDLEPGNRPAQGLLGLVLINNHKFYDALDTADRLLAQDPEDLMALGTRSDALLELGRFQESVQAAQRMVDLKPNLPSYSRAAYLRWLSGDTRRAEDIAWKAIDSGRDPRDTEPIAWAIVQAAIMFWQEGDYPGANAGFGKALDAFKDYPPALVGRGKHALLVQNDAKAAVELLERADRLSPLVETAWLLGDAREAAGDAAGAAAAYALVVKRGRVSDPRTLAQFYATKNRDLDEALKLATAELAVRGGPYTDDAHAWALYRKGMFAEARAASDRALQHGTKDAVLWYHAGAIRIAAGEREAGQKLIRRALALNPRFDATGAAEAASLVAAR